MHNKDIKKAIHLLYVPTIFCNMGCSYCYLGDLTNKKIDLKKAVDTLKYTIEKFTKNGYIPYNLSFHGGEVTTLPPKTLAELFEIAKRYYEDFSNEISSLGYKIAPIHIKTNIFNLKPHYENLNRYKISISGSVDLPLKLHEKYRVDKDGNSTLPQILENLKWLANYKHHKKISCVVTKEHLTMIDEFIEDIKYIHYDIGLDMTKFNIMFSFDSNKNREKFSEPIAGAQMLNQDEQVLFYKKIFEAFEGSDLDEGLKNHWFKEFTPEFCCSAVNCGNKFFLVESDGKISSCPRGQSSPEYSYGNIYSDDIETIIQSGWKQIESNENRLSIDDECLSCEYFPYCNLGCTFVRDETQTSKSYTCKLQKQIYKSNPNRYPPYSSDTIKTYVKHYLFRNKITHASRLNIFDNQEKKEFTITPELYEDKNSLSSIINSDNILKSIYSDKLFKLEVDGTFYTLSSQIIKNRRDIIFLTPKSKINLYCHKSIFSINCLAENESNNNLHIMLLRGTHIVYGDEERLKQEHIFDYSLYKNSLIARSSQIDNYYKLDIKFLFLDHKELFLDGIKNNIFFTTKTMREYHYTKHRKNAFYHIQAINLPFANIEFYWMEDNNE